MKRNIALKGKLKNSLILLLIIGIILVAAAVGLFFLKIDTAAVIMAVACGLYLIIIIIVFVTIRSEIMGEMIAFASEYTKVQKAMLYYLETPYGILDDSGRMLWANASLKELGDVKLAQKGIWNLFPDATPDSFPEGDEPSVSHIKHGDKSYRLEIQCIDMEDFSTSNDAVEISGNRLLAVYLFDETEILRYIKENNEQKLVLGYIYIDNYDEVLDGTNEAQRSLLAAVVESKISKYLQNYDAIVSKYENDRYVFVLKQKYLPNLQSNRFALLDEVREISMGNTTEVSLSIGVGVGAESYGQLIEWARSSIDLALGRGGDQAVVKVKDKIFYYGGKKITAGKNTKVRARVKAHALKQLLGTRDSVIIMGHTRTDTDSFGAAIGVYSMAKQLNKRAYIVMGDISDSLKPIVSMFKNNNYEPEMFISADKAAEIMDQNTVLVIVDVNRVAITESPRLVNLSKTTVVIDHHRQSGDSIDSATLSYIDPYASSASEMVTDMLRYIDDDMKLKKEEADALYSGIMIDTDGFTCRTGSNTFEAAAFLRKKGTDVVRVRGLLSDDFETCMAKAKTVSSATIIDNIYAFASCNGEGLRNPTIVGAQAANDLLDITGVKASFVFTEVKGTIFISARSLGEINVQLVMEALGGGGHSTMAGAQMKDVSVGDAMAIVKNELIRMRSEGEI